MVLFFLLKVSEHETEVQDDKLMAIGSGVRVEVCYIVNASWTCV